MRFLIKNAVTKKEYSFFDIEDIDDSRLFYHFNIQLPKNIDDGSYNYWLFDGDGNQIAYGNLMIGDFKQTNTTYTKNNEYIQYKG